MRAEKLIGERAEGAHDLDARHHGHAPVEHGNLVFVGAQESERPFPISDGVDHVAVLPEPPLEDRAESDVVFGNEHPHA